jgi:urocanate hydratase
VIHAPPATGLSSATAPDQAAVFHLYQQLRRAVPGRTLSGRLVLSVGFRDAGAALALATVIAQGCFLGLEPEAASLKRALQTGACDFMVNTLDEALRVLKNELRKGTPLSAGLLCQPQPILNEMVARGVQPDWITGATDEPALGELVARGATRLTDLPDAAAQGDALVRLRAASLADMRRVDALTSPLVADDLILRDWMQHAPAYFSRQLPPLRVVALSQEQIAQLRGRLRAAAQEKLFEAAISVESPDGPVSV